MSLIINPSDEADSGSSRPTLTPGRRTMWVCGVDFGTSQAGNKKIDVRLVCVDDGGTGSEVGAYCWDTFTLTQAAAWRLGQAARALGQTEQFEAEDQSVMEDMLRRCPLVVDLEDETYNDKTKLRPKLYTLHTGAIPEAWEDIVQKGEEWHEGGKKMRSGGGYSSAPTSTGTSDEIPF